jgi:hypothetical protein
MNSDATPAVVESTERCASCHSSQPHQDFVFTLDRMKAAN